MRKIDPHGVKGDFQTALHEVEGLYNAFVQAFPGDKRKINRMAEQSILMLGVLFESFVTDLLVAYVNRNTSGLRADLEIRIRQHTKDKCGAAAEKLLEKMVFKTHIKKGETYAVLDKVGQNFAFKDASALVSKAEQFLAPNDGRRFSQLSIADRAILDAVKKMRNWVGHRSSAAKKQMNNALADTNLLDELRRGANAINDLGAHLKSVGPNQNRTRLALYFSAVTRIAGSL